MLEQALCDEETCRSPTMIPHAEQEMKSPMRGLSAYARRPFMASRTNDRLSFHPARAMSAAGIDHFLEDFIVAGIASDEYVNKVDFSEVGAGPLVVLVHASLGGARQWSSLMGDLGDRFRVRAVNLFGYGGTPAWSRAQPPTLDDFAALVARAVPATARKIRLVGHSFGGAVAMHAAAHQLRGRVERLVLVEPSLFYLLEPNGQRAAFREISSLARFTRERMAAGAMHDAGKRFIDYWSGPGAWAEMPEGTKAALVALMLRVAHEWDAILSGTTSAAEWAALLPAIPC